MATTKSNGIEGRKPIVNSHVLLAIISVVSGMFGSYQWQIKAFDAERKAYQHQIDSTRTVYEGFLREQLRERQSDRQIVLKHITNEN